MCMYVCICLYVYMYVYVYIYICVYICMSMCMYIYVYIKNIVNKFILYFILLYFICIYLHIDFIYIPVLVVLFERSTDSLRHSLFSGVPSKETQLLPLICLFYYFMPILSFQMTYMYIILNISLVSK